MSRIALFGATGTIGRATAQALVGAGHEVVALVRRPPTAPLPGVTVRIADPADPVNIARDGFAGEAFDIVVSCMASRTGSPKDAWAVDHAAHLEVLRLAKAQGVRQFVLLSAICVQKPLLSFQHAKLEFEAALVASAMDYSIVRPTAYFKSLSGQVARVKAGKPFLIFGDGRLTACKPISDADLGAYLADCLDNPARRNRILPIGGPGPALTSRQMGEELFRLLGRAPKFKSVPVGLMDAIIGVLTVLGKLSPKLRDKAEFARIGRYYATESMLVWNPQTGHYDADATPETGQDRLFDFYASLLTGEATVDLGEHAVFQTS